MEWDEPRIQAILNALRAHRGDTTLVEVKRAAGGLPESLPSTVCAFANMPDGGTILLGIDETNGFEVTGVDDPAGMSAALVNQSRDKVAPTPYISTFSLPVDGKQVVVAEVSPLRLVDKPAEVDGKAYLRQADGDFAMHEHELRMIEAEKVLLAQSYDYDRQVIQGLTVDELVPEIVEQYLVKARARDKRLRERSDSEILRRTGVLLSSGEPTLAGLYAMGDYPQGQYPSLTVTAAVQVVPDASGVRNRDLRHFTGPIPVLLEELMDWCQQNLSQVRHYRADGHMGERPELPLSAVRELLANALVHRDLGPNTLGTGKGIQVRITANHLFILSPGGLRGVSVEQLESTDHAQAAVNQRLYSIAQKLETTEGSPVIEGEGGGLREVFRSAEEYGLPVPTLINTGVQFKALLWRAQTAFTPVPERALTLEPAVPPLGDNQPVLSPRPAARLLPQGVTVNEPAVLAVLARRGEATFRELQHELGLSAGQIRYALNRAVEAGKIEMVGGQGQRRTTYRLLE